MFHGRNVSLPSFTTCPVLCGVWGRQIYKPEGTSVHQPDVQTANLEDQDWELNCCIYLTVGQEVVLCSSMESSTIVSPPKNVTFAMESRELFLQAWLEEMLWYNSLLKTAAELPTPMPTCLSKVPSNPNYSLILWFYDRHPNHCHNLILFFAYSMAKVATWVRRINWKAEPAL